nr:extracellular solute-binding protein [Sneathiella chinensis]
MHGDLKYAPGFSHFDYVNPKAPVGGTLRLGAIGSFPSLNPFLVKGVAARGLGLVYQSLLSRSRDEPFSLYANIARRVEMAEDRRWVIFHLDPDARFSDGSPIRAEDVIFSLNTLRDKGRPNHRHYYSRVAAIERTGPLSVKMTFDGEAVWELPLIMGLMPVLSERFFQRVPFETTSLIPPVGSGPYRLQAAEPGRSITYRRNPDFWGWHLPQYQGRHNFEAIRWDYFRDTDVALQAFKAGDLDARFETDPTRWVLSLNETDRANRRYQTTVIPKQTPAPMRGLVFNTRRAIFQDRKVREALGYLLDFEWMNRNQLHGLYSRTSSFFQNSDLAARGRPSPEEKALLTPFKKTLPIGAFGTAVRPPVSDGSGRDRRAIRQARKHLLQAGWQVQDGRLTHRETGRPFQIEILLNDSQYLKLLHPFRVNLQRLGIETDIRLVDSASYQNRINQYDFDMIVTDWAQSLSPGNEQAFYWGQSAADTPGTRNYPGIRLDAVDAMIQRISAAHTRDDLILATRTLDRILRAGHYVIPLYHNNEQWLAHAASIGLPETPSFYGTGPDVWWQAPIDGPPSQTP